MVDLEIRIFIHSFIYIYLFIHSIVHLVVYPFVYCYLFIHLFIHLFRSHLEVGLHHLGETEKRVVLMKSELEQLQPEIHSKAQVYYHGTCRI